MYNWIVMRGWLSKNQQWLLSVCNNMFVYHMRGNLTTQIFNLAALSLTRGIEIKVDADILFGRLVRLNTGQVFIETHAPTPEHVLLIFQCAKCKRLTERAIRLPIGPRGTCLLWGGGYESWIKNQESSVLFSLFPIKQLVDFPRIA